MLEEDEPVLRQFVIDRLERVHIAVEGGIEIGLAGEIRSIGDPYGERARAELAADLDTFEIVLDRLGAGARIGMGEGTEFVGAYLVFRILEGVGIHRIEGEIMGRRLLAQRAIVRDLVPGDMRRDRGGRSGELVDDAAILDLVEDVPGLARPRKARETGAASAHPPGRHRDGIIHRPLCHRFDIDPASCELAAKRRMVLSQMRFLFAVLLGDEISGDGKRHIPDT